MKIFLPLLQLQFQYPQHALWLLLLLPLVAAWLLQMLWKKRILRSLGDAKLILPLLQGFAPKRPLIKNVFLILAVALLCIALMNPQEPREEGGPAVSGLEIVLALDVSNSMLCTDVQPNRLERARLVAHQLIDTLAGNKIAVVAFAGEAWLQLPLTTDMQAAKLLLSSVQPQSVPIEGTDIAQALQVSNQGLPVTDASHKAVILFTDGEELDGDAKAAVDELKQAGVMLITVGVGTPAGATIRDASGNPLRSDDGTIVVSRLNETLLSGLAAETKGSYVSLTTPEETRNKLLSIIQSLPRKPLVNSNMVNYYSYSHWLIALALLFMILSATISERSRKKILQGSKAKATIYFLVLFSSTCANGQKAIDKIMQGDESYAKGQMTEAEQQYQQALKMDASVWQAQLQLGNIAYKRGKFEDALNFYKASLQNKMNDEDASAIMNNMGLAYARQKKLEQAVEAFKQAIRINPGDEELKNNLNMALDEMMRNRNNANQPSKDTTKQNKQQTEDRLNALQEEEKKIRQNLMKQKKSSKVPGSKNW